MPEDIDNDCPSLSDDVHEKERSDSFLRTAFQYLSCCVLFGCAIFPLECFIAVALPELEHRPCSVPETPDLESVRRELGFSASTLHMRADLVGAD